MSSERTLSLPTLLRSLAAVALAAVALGSLLAVTRADAQVGANQPPVASNDVATTAEDTLGAIDVLTNDTDADGDTLTMLTVADPAHGTASITVDGAISYLPDANYHGADSFTYTVGDGNGDQDTATVAVTVTPVNDTPVAVNDAATTSMDTAVSIDPRGNDTDVDGDTLVVASAGAPAHGVATVTAAGTVAYTPTAGFTGTDPFTYVVSDGNGGTATGTITVTVEVADSAPVALDDTASTKKQTAVTIDVLANDSDADGDVLTVLSTSIPANGTVILNADGAVTYTPADEFTGDDAFTYVVSDGNGNTDTAAVTVSVTKHAFDGARHLKERCKSSGWTGLGFPNQGLCVAFFARMIGDHDRDEHEHGWKHDADGHRGDHDDDDDADGDADQRGGTLRDHEDHDGQHGKHDKRSQHNKD